MAVVSKHLSANLRFRDSQDVFMQTMHRVRPDLTASNVLTLREGLSIFTDRPTMSAVMTIAEELKDEDADDADI